MPFFISTIPTYRIAAEKISIFGKYDESIKKALSPVPVNTYILLLYEIYQYTVRDVETAPGECESSIFERHKTFGRVF